MEENLTIIFRELWTMVPVVIVAYTEISFARITQEEMAGKQKAA